MSENKINRIKEYCKENIKENKKDKLQVIIQIITIQLIVDKEKSLYSTISMCTFLDNNLHLI